MNALSNGLRLAAARRRSVRVARAVRGLPRRQLEAHVRQRRQRKCFQLAPAKRRARKRSRDPRTDRCWTTARIVGITHARSIKSTPSFRCRRIWIAAIQTINAAPTFTAMNGTPTPEGIAGIPTAIEARIQRIPTTQAIVDATRTPRGTSGDGVAFGTVGGGVVTKNPRPSSNGLRLSCGATLSRSQTQFYNR